MNGKNKEKGLFRVVVYFNESEFMIVAELAQKLGKRSVYIPIKKQKPHGMADEWVANTKGIAITLKELIKYYRDMEAERTAKLADVLQREKQIQAEKAKLGV
jgi:predicted RNA-binding protein YlxR (DUF448 family)